MKLLIFFIYVIFMAILCGFIIPNYVPNKIVEFILLFIIFFVGSIMINKFLRKE